MRTRRQTRRLALLATLAATVALASPAGAQAAAEFELSADLPATSVRAYPGGNAQIAGISVRNVGDAAMPFGSVTVTATVPAPLRAISVTSPNVDLFSAPNWACTISVDRDIVTCTGPAFNNIDPGQESCQAWGQTCPISIGLKADNNAPLGVKNVSVEASGGGAATEGLTFPIKVKNFGDDFGFAPINDGAGPANDSGAFGPATEAFWAGACDRTAASPIGDPVPADGFGSRPTTIPVPDGATAGGSHVTGPAPATPPHCIDWGGVIAGGNSSSDFPGTGLWARSPLWRLPSEARAGSHPDGSATMLLRREGPGGNHGEVDGTVDNIVVDLPPGFVGNPEAVPACTNEQFSKLPSTCPPQSQVGVLNLDLIASPSGGNNLGGPSYDALYPIWNLEPRPGRAAEFGFSYASSQKAVAVRLTGVVRDGSDRGVTAMVGQAPSPLPLIGQMATLWGVPWEAANDKWRGPADLLNGAHPCNFQPGPDETVSSYIPWSGLTAPGCAQSYDPSWGPIVPFLTQETDCNPAPTTTMRIDQYLKPGSYDANGEPVHSDPNWITGNSPSAPVTDCETLGFDPDITLDPTAQGGASVQSADSATGLDVELTIPQNNDLPFDPPAAGAPKVEVEQYVADASAYWKSDAGRATAHLRDTTVTLPEGLTLNPAAADGQGACSTEQMGLTDTNSPTPPKIRFDNSPVQCPESSKVAEVVVETPLLDEADWPKGEVYLAKQGDNPFNSDFAIYIVLESPERGVRIKLAGEVVPDPQTGRLTTTVTENPELPFDRFTLRFKGGPRAPLATPVTCGTHTNTTALTPHSNPNVPVVVDDPFEISSSPAGGCPGDKGQRPLNLGFEAGSTQLVAGAHSPFTMRIQRPDGNQELERIEITTPEGFAAKLAGVPYCPDGAIAQAAGRTASGDGALEQASPSCPEASKVGTTTIGAGAGAPFYVKGNVYLAGPYKGAPISLAFVVPAIAGPFDLGVQVVRTALTVNSRTAQVTAVSDPIPQILRGVPLRLRDIRVDIDRPGFTLNPTDCAEQVVTGRISGSHGAVSNVSNRFQIAECARLGFKPKLTLRLKGGTKRAKYQGLTAIVTTRPGDANIARAAVTMPRSAFLAQEHIRTVCTRVQFAADACPAGSIYGKATAWSPLLDEPLTGNVYLRSSDNNLPDLVPDLRGPASQPIKVELSGRTDSVKGALRNTFDLVPDAPVTRFQLELFGGKKGLIVNSQNLCTKLHRATVKLGAQNGRSHSFRPVVKNGCTKKQLRRAKAKAKAKARKQAKRARHGR